MARRGFRNKSDPHLWATVYVMDSGALYIYIYINIFTHFLFLCLFIYSFVSLFMCVYFRRQSIHVISIPENCEPLKPWSSAQIRLSRAAVEADGLSLKYLPADLQARRPFWGESPKDAQNKQDSEPSRVPRPKTREIPEMACRIRMLMCSLGSLKAVKVLNSSAS